MSQRSPSTSTAVPHDRRRSRHAAALCPARRPRAQQSAFRLRARAMRRLHRASRRAAVRSCVTPVSAVGDAKVMTLAGPRHAGETASAADRLCRGAGAAVRLLHQRLDHDRRRVPARQEEADRAEIKEALDGLKCRCGTHMNILRAVKRAADDDGLREGAMTKIEQTSAFSRRSLLKAAAPWSSPSVRRVGSTPCSSIQRGATRRARNRR